MTTKIEKCPTCGGDVVNRSKYCEAVVENGDELSYKLFRVEMEVKKFYLALDNAEDSQRARRQAFENIQNILEMKYQNGKIKDFVDRHPKLKKLYEVK